ncbi:quinon protein alcohol dehydrogenase-like superfamily [Podospora appendiculata]|uniref:Quinon protein alcohol dehydrogenase-like superfamily n=1 Tax=Podospora appendiculata TaxID=314037 RepID=A0AAE0XGS5_9PEZI|nr:quinon protein alcohol dehydrogenase-like superfamily [Podospora appendiculata]
MQHSLLAAALLHAAACVATGTAASESAWLGWGGNPFNNRWASANTKISSANIQTAAVHCKLDGFLPGISATPAVANGIVYFPAFNGSLVALDYEACKVKWQINVTQLIVDYAQPTLLQTQTTTLVSRTTPQLDLANKILYFATQTHGLIVAADLTTGAILGYKRINPHPLVLVTISPTLLGDTLFLGASSGEESVAFYTDSYNFTFIGNAAAVRYNRHTRAFTTLWDVPMLPPDDPSTPGRWSGVGVWGSQPSLDLKRNQVFYGTGNVYSTPDAFIPCTADPTSPACALPPKVLQESIIAFDITTGKINWIRHLGPLDSWTLACFVDPIITALCPNTPGPDADFGMAPTFIPGGGKRGNDILVVGQKNGIMHSLDAATGKVEWSTAGGPGSVAGGVVWGIAADASRAYFNEANPFNAPWKPQPQNSTVITAGAYGAIDIKTGAILWQTSVGGNFTASNAPTVVGDLVLAGKEINSGSQVAASFLAFKKSTGQVLLDLPLNTYFQSAISVAGKYIFFGSGYRGVTVPGSFYVLKVI